MKFLFSVFFFIVFVSFLTATIINVPADQPTIQAGINVAVDGDTVLAQPGTYVENINYDEKSITVASLFLTTQDTTYISQTIIDGNQDGSVVTFESEEGTTSVLTGFTITNGFADYGGGIYCYESSPSLSNVTITGNSTDDHGGGVYCNDSSPSLINVTITGNSADRGGGVYCDDYSNPSLVNVIITGNSAEKGGGVYCWQSSPNLENVTITDNFASGTFGEGGGIYCNGESNPSLINVTITGNSAPFMGGGIYCHNSSPSLINIIITNNSTGNGGGIYCNSSSPSLVNITILGNDANWGGGIFCQDDSNPGLSNVIIIGNSADKGGGVYCWQSSPGLINVIVAGNSAEDGGGIFCNVGSNPILVNCILWNDIPQEIYFYHLNDPNSVTISYSDIQGGEAGIVTNNNGTVSWLEGNMDENPLFVGTGEDPYSLLEDSPCIDAGIPDTEGLNLPPWDIIGNLRIWDGDGNGSAIIDMGAYEYGAPPYVDVENNIVVQTPELFLYQNYPNPFNPNTTINYQLPAVCKVQLSIYNIKGEKVKTLVKDKLEEGKHIAIWDGKDEQNKPVSSGIYFYKLKTGENSMVRKMILLR